MLKSPKNMLLFFIVVIAVGKLSMYLLCVIPHILYNFDVIFHSYYYYDYKKYKKYVLSEISVLLNHHLWYIKIDRSRFLHISESLLEYFDIQSDFFISNVSPSPLLILNNENEDQGRLLLLH